MSVDQATATPEETPSQRRVRERKEALTEALQLPIWTEQKDANAVARHIGLKDRQGLTSWLTRHGEKDTARLFLLEKG